MGSWTRAESQPGFHEDHHLMTRETKVRKQHSRDRPANLQVHKRGWVQTSGTSDLTSIALSWGFSGRQRLSPPNHCTAWHLARRSISSRVAGAGCVCVWGEARDSDIICTLPNDPRTGLGGKKRQHM